MDIRVANLAAKKGNEFVATHLSSDALARAVLMIPALFDRVMAWPKLPEALYQRLAAYDKNDPKFAARSPIERAVVAFLLPSLLPSEREFVQQNQWKMAFLPMDWHLNDLTGGGHGVGH